MKKLKFVVSLTTDDNDYQVEQKESAEQAARKTGSAQKPRAAAPPAASKPRKRPYKEQRELDTLPAAIEKMESEQTALQTTLGDPALFNL